MDIHLASLALAPLPAPLPTQPINELEVALQVTYFVLLVPLALLGMHRAWMVILWAIHRKAPGLSLRPFEAPARCFRRQRRQRQRAGYSLSASGLRDSSARRPTGR